MSVPQENRQPGAEPAPAAEARTERARLGPTVSADLEAIKNDMEQARELAAEYQRELAGKSNELASLRQLFERTREHLIQLQTSITKLREERHRLANEAMRAEALEFKLQRVTAEHDRLREEAMRAEALERKLQLVTAERDRLRDEQSRRMWGD